MKKTRQYSKAPITEAAIAIQVQIAPGVKPEDFEAMAKEEVSRYPVKHPVFQRGFHIHLGPDPAPESPPPTSTQIGFRMLDTSQKQVAQVNFGGFVFSRLNPYKGWHDFMPEAKRLWAIYREIAHPVSILRVGVRYVNRIDIPCPVNDLQEYLPMTPNTNEAAGMDLAGLFSQVRVLQPDLGASATITHAKVEPDPTPDKLSVILDIDTFKDRDLPITEGPLWGLIEDFHKRKNKIFEACISDKVRDLIK